MGLPDDLDAFVRAREPALLRLGVLLTGSPERAADLVQEALGRLLAARARVRAQDPEAYVRKTMVNLSVSAWRRSRRERLVADPPEVAYDDALGDHELWRAVAALPPRPAQGRRAALRRGPLGGRDGSNHGDVSGDGEEPDLQGARLAAGHPRGAGVGVAVSERGDEGLGARLRAALADAPGAARSVDVREVRRRAAQLRRRRRGSALGATVLAVAALVAVPLLGGALDARRPIPPAVIEPAPTAGAPSTPATRPSAATSPPAVAASPAQVGVPGVDLAVVRADGLHVITARGDSLVPDTVGATYPAWSPSGALAWLQGGQAWRLALDGGTVGRSAGATATPEQLGEANGLAWSSRGVLAVTSSNGVAQVSADTQGLVVDAGSARDPVWDPAGRRLAYSSEAGIVVLTDGRARTVRSVGACSMPATWLGDHLLVWRNGGMCSASLAADGLPLALVDVPADTAEDGPLVLAHPGWVRPIDAGRAAVIAGSGRSAGKAVRVAPRHGPGGPADDPSRSTTSLDSSPDGASVSVDVPAQKDESQVGPGGRAVLSVPNGRARQVGPPAARAAALVGGNVLVLAGDPGHLHLWVVPTGGGGGSNLGETARVTDAYYGWFPLAQVAAASLPAHERASVDPRNPAASTSAAADLPPAPVGAADPVTAAAAPGLVTTTTADLDGDSRPDRVILDTGSGTLTAALADGRRLSSHPPGLLGSGLSRLAGVSDLFGTGRPLVLVAVAPRPDPAYRPGAATLTPYRLKDGGLLPCSRQLARPSAWVRPAFMRASPAPTVWSSCWTYSPTHPTCTEPSATQDP